MIQHWTGRDVIRILAVSLLVIRLAFRRLDVSVELCLDLWRHRPPIVVSIDQVQSRWRLRDRVDLMFPF